MLLSIVMMPSGNVENMANGNLGGRQVYTGHFALGVHWLQKPVHI